MKIIYACALSCVAALLTVAAVHAQEPADSVEKTVCLSAIGYDSLDALQQDLLLNAKRMAVDELFGELITASTTVDDFIVTSDEIRSTSLGLIRVGGSLEYANGENIAEVCLHLTAYTTPEDRAQFEPVPLSKRHCEGDPRLTAGEIQEKARENAIVQALIEYDGRLEEVGSRTLRRLMQRVSYSDSGFVPETQTYCTTVTGEIVPIQIMAVLGGAELYPATEVRATPNDAALSTATPTSEASTARTATIAGKVISFSSDGETLSPEWQFDASEVVSGDKAGGPNLPLAPWETVSGGASISGYVIEDETLRLVMKGQCSSSSRYDRSRGARTSLSLSGDFTVQVRLDFEPSSEYQAAGIYLSPIDDIATRIGVFREFNSSNSEQEQHLVGADAVLGGEVTGLGGWRYTRKTTYLRITRRGDLFTLAASELGDNWLRLKEDHWFPLPDELQLSLFVHNACGGSPIVANFSDLTLAAPQEEARLRPDESAAFEAPSGTGSLADYWVWSPGLSKASTYRVEENKLILVTGPKTDYYRDSRSAPRVFTRLTQDFTLETTVGFITKANWQMVAVSVSDANDPNNRAEIRMGGRSPEEQILEVTDTIGGSHPQRMVVDFPDNVVTLRIVRDGPFMDFLYSTDSESWQPLLEDYVTSLPEEVFAGFYVYSTANAGASATFSNLRIELE